MKGTTVLTCSLVLALSWTISGADRRQQTAPKADAVDPFAEYPPYESSLVGVLRHAADMKRAADVLARAAGGAERVQAILMLGDRGRARGQGAVEAIAATRDVIERHPEAIAPLIDALTRALLWSWNDGARDYRPAMRDILDAARTKVTAPGAREAAQLAYQLIQLELALNRGQKWSATEPLKALAQQYPGTEGAWRAELDLARGRRRTCPTSPREP